VGYAKYRAVPLDIEGRNRQVCAYLNIPFVRAFDSTGEYTRYVELTRLENSGQIYELHRQVDYPLVVNARVICHYVADFVYRDIETDDIVVEDFKSRPTMTPVYRLKKKLMKAIHGIEIKESMDADWPLPT
jgi:hypothetical protein